MAQMETSRFREEWDLLELTQRLTEPLLDLGCTDAMAYSLLRRFSRYPSRAYSVLATVKSGHRI